MIYLSFLLDKEDKENKLDNKCLQPTLTFFLDLSSC